MIWREKRILLIVLGVLLLANAFFFLTYRVQYQSRLDEIDSQVDSLEAQLEQARLARVRTEKKHQSYRQVEQDVEKVFNELWSTQPQRLTLLIGEIKRLAAAANLAPQSYSFTRSESQGEDKTRRQKPQIGAVDVVIGFSVTGSYEQIRRLINLLELSRQFVIINKVSLSAAAENNLTLNLQLKTLFRDDDQNAAGDRL